ncbi:MAG: ROK family protein [Thermomicrobiales bacterium]
METFEEPPPSGDAGAVVVGVDLGASKVALMATDAASGDDLAHDRFPTPADIGPDAMIEQLCDAILTLVEQAGRSPDALCAFGVAVPGPVDVRNGRVILAGNLHGWVDVPLRATLHHQLDIPAWVDQDAKAAALGERWRGCATAMETFVFLALGTGIGAGLFINGQLHRGRHHGASEVGNVVMGREYLGRERIARELARPPALMGSVLGEDAQLFGATFGALQVLKEENDRTQ